MSHYSKQRNQDYQDRDLQSLLLLACRNIAEEEGFRNKAYFCAEGYPTIGYGKRIGDKGQPLEHFKFDLPEPVAREWLKQAVLRRLNRIDYYPNVAAAFHKCDQARQVILLSMAYQMGTSGLSKFTNTLSALERGDYEKAARQSLDSRWARQTPERAKDHAHTLRTGELV